MESTHSGPCSSIDTFESVVEVCNPVRRQLKVGERMAIGGQFRLSRADLVREEALVEPIVKGELCTKPRDVELIRVA